MTSAALTPLRDKLCVFIDGSSLETVSQHWPELQGGPQHLDALVASATDQQDADRRWTRHAITIVASTVAYDHILFDEHRQALLNMDVIKQLPGVLPLQIPDDVRRKVTDDISTLPASGINLAIGAPLGATKYFEDKQFQDLLFRLSGAHGRLLTDPVIVDSTTSVPKLFYTTETAGQLNIPYLLHPVKSWLIAELQKDIEQQLLSLGVLQSELKQAFLNSIPSIGAASRRDVFDVPPLESYLLRYARAQRLPLIEAATKLRETDEAREFRKWLKNLTTRFHNSGVEAYTRAAQEIDELKALAARGESRFHRSNCLELTSKEQWQ